jgi:hypothetical protein
VLAALSEQAVEDTPTGRAHAQLLGGGGKAGGLGWWWHTPEDTLDKIDPDFFKRDADLYLAILVELVSRERLPIEPGAGLIEMADALDAYESAANGALVLEDLSSQARELASRVSAGALAQLDTVTANKLIADLCRILIPVNFTESGPYDHDLALGALPVPGLRRSGELATLDPAGSEYRFLRTRLVRERNRVAGALRAVEARLAVDGR